MNTIKSVTHIRPWARLTKALAPLTLKAQQADKLLHSGPGCAVRLVDDAATFTIAVVIDHRDGEGVYSDILTPATYKSGKPYLKHVQVRDGKATSRSVDIMLHDDDMQAIKALVAKHLK